MYNLCKTYLMILNYTKISYKIPRGFIAAKKRIEVSLEALLRCLLFVMFPAAVFFLILRRLCFSRISRSGEIRCALGNPSAVRNVPCAAENLFVRAVSSI